MASITVTGLVVSRGGRRVLHGIDLEVADGELLALIGASGSGKTSLLRAVAGLDPVESGEVVLGGEVVTRLEPQHRRVAMVFQDAVLYPFLTARGNVAFPLQVEHRPSEEIEARVSAEVRALGLEHLAGSRPGELSAGHRQLVQVARAMVRAPQALLLDEPLAMVDARARAAMRAELRTVQQGYGVTALYVTNDPVEAMAMGDRVAVISAGHLVQLGAPETVYAEPATVEVAEVTGDASVVAMSVHRDPPGFRLTAGGLSLRVWPEALAGRVGATVTVALRPEDVLLGRDAGEGDGPFPAVVTAVEPVGHHDLLVLDAGGVTLRSRAAPGTVARGDRLPVTLRRPHLFDHETGERI